jgi:hypothetical protein
MMKVTFETKAWLSKNSNMGPDELCSPEGAVGLHYTPHDMSTYGDAYIGIATVTVEIPGIRELVENKVESLRNQAAALRAETTAKLTVIDGQIQNLLAIEYTPAAGAEA